MTKEFMPRHDYGTTFEFKTVFYKSAFSYVCCSCAFEHEFLLYIDGEGNINEEIYQKIEQNIIVGRCPHVDNVSAEWTRESSTSSLHIALATGTEEIVNDNLGRRLYSSCGLFQLDLLDIAFHKTKLESFDGFVQFHRLPAFDESQSECWWNRHLKYILGGHDKVKVICRDSSGNMDCCTVKELSVFEIAVGSKNVPMLEHILQRTYCVSGEHIHAINYIIKHGQREQEDCFIDFMKNEEGSSFVVEHFIEAAIVYNHPESLEKIMLTDKQQMKHKMIDKRTLLRISNLIGILNRGECKRVLEKYRVFRTKKISDSKQISELLNLLKRFGKSCKNEVLTAVRQIKNVNAECRNYVDRNLIISIDNIASVVEDTLSAGVDIFDEDVQPENSWFTRILQQLFYHDQMVANTMRLLIGANPDLDQQHGVVEVAFHQDNLVYNYGNILPATGTYIIDMKEHGALEHGAFGHDELDFALNFAGPFLLECGFPATTVQLAKALDMDLHPAEHEYIKAYIRSRQEPRSLDIMCRETLRKNFRGLKLHGFLEYSKCPQKIKDFILLNVLLQPSQRNKS